MKTMIMARRIFNDNNQVVGYELDQSDKDLIEALMTEPNIKEACEKAGIHYYWAVTKARQLCEFGIIQRVFAIPGPEYAKAMNS